MDAIAIAGNAPGAIQQLENNRSVDEVAPWKDWLLGSQYFYAGSAQDAREHLKEVVALQPKFMPGQLLYGNALSLTGDTPNAIDALEMALSQGAGRDGYSALGRAHLRAQQWPEAIRHLDRARTLGKPELVLLKELAFALFQAGSYSESARTYQDAFALDSNPSTLLMAVLSLREGKLEEQALALLDAIDADSMPRPRASAFMPRPKMRLESEGRNPTARA